MAKKNNNLIIGIVIAVVVVIAIIIGVVVATKKGGDGGTGGTDGEQGGGSTSREVYDSIDVAVGYGDYEVMEAQAKAIQNGEMVGQVIQIDGIVMHPMSKYSIGEENENGLKMGTEFEIEGASEEDYPNDGDHVVITGEVVEKSPMYFIIKTTPENVVVLETAE